VVAVGTARPLLQRVGKTRLAVEVAADRHARISIRHPWPGTASPASGVEDRTARNAGRSEIRGEGGDQHVSCQEESAGV